MDTPAYLWFLAVGGLLVWMALAGSLLRRLPASAAMFYLAAGFLVGPAVAGALLVDPVEHAPAVERVTEVAVIVSLFTAGLKLRVPVTDRRWVLPGVLATASMLATVGLVTAVGVWGLGLPVGAAVLLGAVLAPTDPVLAADVQVTDPTDRDRVRFGLTGEAGLNDGTAFPFVMLGLGLLGWHDIGDYGWKWAAVDLVWAVAGGLLVGGLLGTAVARLVLYLRRTHQEAVGLDDFLALGLIALAYGAALAVTAYGFLAVFAAGLAFRRVERAETGKDAPADVRDAARLGAGADHATHPGRAPAFLAEAVLGFNERVDRIGEVVGVVLLGTLLGTVGYDPRLVWFPAALILVVRPVAVLPAVLVGRLSPLQGALVGWFGVRGVGSMYYLAFALTHGLPADLGRDLAALTLATVAASVGLHGVSVTPLMNLYARRRGRRAAVEPLPG